MLCPLSPPPFFLVIGQRDKRQRSGVADDGTIFTQGRKNGRDWLPAGRRTGQRAAAAAGFKNAGGNLKIKHTPREILQISRSEAFSDQVLHLRPGRFQTGLLIVILRVFW